MARGTSATPYQHRGWVKREQEGAVASSSPFPISSSSRVPRWGQSQALRPFGDSWATPGPGHRAPRFCGVLARRGPAVLSARLSWPRRRPQWPPLAVSLPVVASAKESQPCSRPGSAPRVSKPPRRGDRDHRRGPAGVEQAPHPSCTSGAARNAGVTGWGASAAPAPSPEPGEPRPRHSGDGPGSKGGGDGDPTPRPLGVAPGLGRGPQITDAAQHVPAVPGARPPRVNWQRGAGFGASKWSSSWPRGAFGTGWEVLPGRLGQWRGGKHRRRPSCAAGQRWALTGAAPPGDGDVVQSGPNLGVPKGQAAPEGLLPPPEHPSPQVLRPVRSSPVPVAVSCSRASLTPAPLATSEHPCPQSSIPTAARPCPQIPHPPAAHPCPQLLSLDPSSLHPLSSSPPAPQVTPLRAWPGRAVPVPQYPHVPSCGLGHHIPPVPPAPAGVSVGTTVPACPRRPRARSPRGQDWRRDLQEL